MGWKRGWVWGKGRRQNFSRKEKTGRQRYKKISISEENSANSGGFAGSWGRPGDSMRGKTCLGRFSGGGGDKEQKNWGVPNDVCPYPEWRDKYGTQKVEKLDLKGAESGSEGKRNTNGTVAKGRLVGGGTLGRATKKSKKILGMEKMGKVGDDFKSLTTATKGPEHLGVGWNSVSKEHRGNAGGKKTSGGTGMRTRIQPNNGGEKRSSLVRLQTRWGGGTKTPREKFSELERTSKYQVICPKTPPNEEGGWI